MKVDGLGKLEILTSNNDICKFLRLSLFFFEAIPYTWPQIAKMFRLWNSEIRSIINKIQNLL